MRRSRELQHCNQADPCTVVAKWFIWGKYSVMLFPIAINKYFCQSFNAEYNISILARQAPGIKSIHAEILFKIIFKWVISSIRTTVQWQFGCSLCCIKRGKMGMGRAAFTYAHRLILISNISPCPAKRRHLNSNVSPTEWLTDCLNDGLADWRTAGLIKRRSDQWKPTSVPSR